MSRWCFLILINLILISFSFCDDINLSNYPCYSVKPPRNARIVGGYASMKGETPYMVVS